MNKKKIAIVIAGCGVYDGAEIHETTLTMLAVMQQGAVYQLFAPNVDQTQVVNHLTGAIMTESRNVLIESARIARGNIKQLSQYRSNDYDALIFPGGYGVVKNLCTYAYQGVDCQVNSEVEKAIVSTLQSGKPIGALCVAPVLLAKVMGKVKVTIGQDQDVAGAILAMGGTHVPTKHGDVVVDFQNKVVTSPCYMLDATIDQIATGTSNLVKEVLQLCDLK